MPEHYWNGTAWVATRGAAGAVDPGGPAPFDRSLLQIEVDEPNTLTTGTIPGVPLTDYYPNATISGQDYYDMRVGGAETNIVNARFHCRVYGVAGGSITNARILGDLQPSPNSGTNRAQLYLEHLTAGQTFTVESVDFTPALENVGPANTGIRCRGNVLAKYCYFSHLSDAIMILGGTLTIEQSLQERVFSTWPDDDPTRTDGDASHVDGFAQVEAGSLHARGCKSSTFLADPLGKGYPLDANGLYYNPALPEWGGRYLPTTNDAGFSCILSSGNLAEAVVDVKFEGGWMEGGRIPVYIVASGDLPTGTISFARTRMRRGVLGTPDGSTSRYHIIKAGAGVVVNTTGTIACTDDRSTWTPTGGGLTISNAG